MRWSKITLRWSFWTLSNFSLFQAKPRQHAVEPVGAEDPHQIVFQRQEEFRASGVALPAGAAAQLVVDAP